MDKIILQGIGSTLLVETCSNALFALTRTPTYKTKRYWESVADLRFIVHDSGLVHLTNYFQLDVDAEELTRIFLKRGKEL